MGTVPVKDQRGCTQDRTGEPMRILLLTHRLPYPLESGQNLRLYHLARHLGRWHELILIAFGDGPYPPPLTEVFREIHTLPIPSVPREPFSFRKIIRAFDVDHLVMRESAMDRLIRNTISRNRPDVIWVGGWDMLVYTVHLDGVPVVVDAMDEGFLECSRELLHARRPLTFLRSLKRLINYVRWERRYFRHAARCLFVSSVDARWARRIIPGLPVSVVESGVDAEFFHPLGGPEEFPSLVFEGNQGFPPNVDAVSFFARKIFPSILQRFPTCRFYIVGRDPGPATRALANDHVIVTGRVEDVRPYLDQVSVFVCPMRTGAGIKNKILQAWAMVKPVIATPVAVGGLRTTPGENIVVAKGATAFADEVIRLLEDPIRRRELGKQGRETVLAYYTWEQQAQALEEVLRGV